MDAAFFACCYVAFCAVDVPLLSSHRLLILTQNVGGVKVFKILDVGEDHLFSYKKGKDNVLKVHITCFADKKSAHRCQQLDFCLPEGQ